MSRSELADAVNTALHQLYPGRDISAHYVERRWVGKLERGEHRWPSDERRAALRHALGVATDTDLDLYIPRRTSSRQVSAFNPRVSPAQPVPRSDLHPPGDLLQLAAPTHRRELLSERSSRRATIGVAVLPNVAPLLDALISPRHSNAVTLSAQQFSRAVAAAKIDYQACRYQRVLDRLVTLLPTLEAVRAEAEGEHRAQVEVLATDLYHVIGSVLLKVGDCGMAQVAAERSTRTAAASQDPVAVAASARIMTHALMANSHNDQAVTLAGNSAGVLDRDTRLASTDAVAVYGALALRGAIAAARQDDRDTAQAMLDEAIRAAARLGYDGNDRWTGFGATNVLLHRVNIALALGDAGTAIDIARTVPLDKVTLAERKASLYLDVAKAYTQWGRYEHGLTALRTAYEVAPEEIRCRPAVQRIAGDLAYSAKGSVRIAVVDFAQGAGIQL